MYKKVLSVMAFVLAMAATDVLSNNQMMPMNKLAMTESLAPNDGSYTRTGKSVTVYTESGHRKGTYAVYLHQGRKYIDFNNTWICIQGKSRFAYNGNWYVIK